jgi:hypothetical protein
MSSKVTTTVFRICLLLIALAFTPRCNSAKLFPLDGGHATKSDDDFSADIDPFDDKVTIVGNSRLWEPRVAHKASHEAKKCRGTNNEASRQQVDVCEELLEDGGLFPRERVSNPKDRQENHEDTSWRNEKQQKSLDVLFVPIADEGTSCRTRGKERDVCSSPAAVTSVTFDPKTVKKVLVKRKLGEVEHLRSTTEANLEVCINCYTLQVLLKEALSQRR